MELRIFRTSQNHHLRVENTVGILPAMLCILNGCKLLELLELIQEVRVKILQLVARNRA